MLNDEDLPNQNIEESIHNDDESLDHTGENTNDVEFTDNSKRKPNKRKQNFERRNIRNIIDDDQFGQDAKDAQKAEIERLKRVKEKEHSLRMFKLLNSDGLKSLKSPLTNNFQNFKPFNHKDIIPKVNPSNLPPASALLTNGMQYKKASNLINKMYRVVPDETIINLDVSDDEDEDFEIKYNHKFDGKVEVIEISDGEEGDDDVDDVIDQDRLDIKNFKKDEFGRVLINVAHPGDEPDFHLSEKIGENIKPHQVSGIRFLYNNLVESVKQFKDSDGFGCILAHSMGLGKTIQIIGFLDILFRCVQAKSALVIVPINTIQNWQSEIDNWLPMTTNVTSCKTEETTADCKPSIPLINPSPGSAQGLRPFNLFVIKECHKTIESRHAVIKDWMNLGGVLLLGYEMFRLLVTYRKSKSSNNNSNKKKDLNNSLGNSDKVPKKKVCIDLELEEKRDGIYQDFLQALIDPGPEVIICDEGHRIKNSEASISKALKSVRTHRRVVMTGYPLQNNLTEYWCMVDFVRPNYLGSKHEFNNMFQRPIDNGQCVDSTVEDRKLMQGRAHVLHELLQGFVQRRSHAVLKASLPPKWEYVLVVKLSPVQRRLYSTFMDQVINGSNTGYNWAQNNILKTYAMCCKIWNHPDILYKLYKEKKDVTTEPDFDFDIEDEYSSTSKPTSKASSMSRRSSITNFSSTSQPVVSSAPSIGSSNGTTAVRTNSCLIKDTPSPSIQDSHINPPTLPDDEASNSSTGVVASNKSSLLQSGLAPSKYMSYQEYLENVSLQQQQQQQNQQQNNGFADSFSWISDDLWKDSNCEDSTYQSYVEECQENGGKIVLFLGLLCECLKYGDKMLLFSQSLLTLDLIEIFLKQSRLTNGLEWIKNKTYFRLDGSTSASERERMITSFNAPESEAGLFLLSTRAGCLGINLIGANRVIVFDASWNPCHDCQAVCRVYRYGQTKPCFIYRLISDHTMEKKIYDRQVKKQGISDRVVDESNPGQQFTRNQVQVLIDYDNPESDLGEEEIDTDRNQQLESIGSKELNTIRQGCAEEDPVLGRIIEQHCSWITKIPFTHESLLIDQKTHRLTKREKRKAKERYELDKRQSLYYQRNNYSEYFIVKTTDVQTTALNKPLNSIRNSSIIANPVTSSLPPPLLTNQITPLASNLPIVAPSNPVPTSSLIQPQLKPNLNPAFRLNRNFTRPTRPLRPTGALMREIEQARLRCGFAPITAVTATTASTSTKLTNSASTNESSTQNKDDTSISKMNNTQSSQFNNKSDFLKGTDPKNIKVVKINATIEMQFPAIQSSSLTSQAGSPAKTKISVGEPLEIIYTSRGKFLRVSRTGDLFAIKDNSAKDKSNPVSTTIASTASISSIASSTDTMSISSAVSSIETTSMHSTNSSQSISTTSINNLLPPSSTTITTAVISTPIVIPDNNSNDNNISQCFTSSATSIPQDLKEKIKSPEVISIMSPTPSISTDLSITSTHPIHQIFSPAHTSVSPIISQPSSIPSSTVNGNVTFCCNCIQFNQYNPNCGCNCHYSQKHSQPIVTHPLLIPQQQTFFYPSNQQHPTNFIYPHLYNTPSANANNLYSTPQPTSFFIAQPSNINADNQTPSIYSNHLPFIPTGNYPYPYLAAPTSSISASPNNPVNQQWFNPNPIHNMFNPTNFPLQPQQQINNIVAISSSPISSSNNNINSNTNNSIPYSSGYDFLDL